MNIFNGLEQIVKTNHELAEHTWYGLGGPADYFIAPRTTRELKNAVKRCNENDLPIYVIGFGSNLLVADKGLRAAVIKLEGDEFGQTRFNGHRITTSAGADLGKLVLKCVQKGLSGIEAMTGIPGSIGGAVKMNAGGRFGDIGSAIESVTLMDSRGTIFEKSKPELSFDYRSTNITAKFILSACLMLTPADPEQIMRTVKESWIYRKNSQPLNTRNCGCVFKNPPGAFAGALIDKAGLKGFQIGGAVVSEKHANFVVAQEGCKSNDVIKLIDTIKQRVKKEFDIELETEIEIWQ